MSPSTSSRGTMLPVVVALVIGLTVFSSAPSAHALNFGEKFLQFTFYLHDNLLSTTNASAFVLLPPLVALPGAPRPPVPSSFFGATVVFDDSMTIAPSETSLEIARGRGIYVFDANDAKGAAIEFLWTAEFNAASGYGDGSTLTFKGFDRTTNPVREIAIVGGTGKFRLARGWAVITTVSQTGPLNATANLKFVANVYYDGCPSIFGCS